MNNAAIISGYSVCMPFADNYSQLIDNLKQRKHVIPKPWFKTDEQAIKCGFKDNTLVATLNDAHENALDRLCQMIDETLLQAQLSKQDLAKNNVRIYLTGLGPRVDGQDFNDFYNHNDVEDIKVTTSMTHLDACNMSQDQMSNQIAQRYQLKYLPPIMNCASNSSLTAVHLASHAIECGGIDVAIILNCSLITSQDIWFLGTQSMLDSDIVQPFGENSKGVLITEGYSALLLENSHHRQARKQTGGICLQTAYMQISSGRSNDPSWLSMNVHKVMQAAMKKSNIDASDIAAIIPHGNGSSASDKAEANALSLFVGDKYIPILAYKGQIGYTTTGSGIVDLIIGHHSLTHCEIIPPVSNDAIIKCLEKLLLVNDEVTRHDKSHLLKIGIGLDGSVIAVVMSAIQETGK